MTNPAVVLNELIGLTRDSLSFDTAALAQTGDSQLRAILRCLVEAKSQLIRTLSGHLSARGDSLWTEAVLVDASGKTYADVGTQPLQRNDAALIDQLESYQDLLLGAFEEAATYADDPELHGLLEQQLPKIRMWHFAATTTDTQISLEFARPGGLPRLVASHHVAA